MDSAKILVIGGGVIGLNAAYQIALKRPGRVVLLEKRALGDGASSRAAGIGTHLMWSQTGIRARKIGFQLFRQFSEEWDDYHFHDEHGCLNLFTPDTWPSRQALLPMYDQLGVKYAVLDASEIHRLWPALNPPEGFIGLHDPVGGYSEPAEFISALSNRVREVGVEVLEHETVVDFIRRGDRILGVRTSNRTIEADAVISTVHVWSLPLWKPLPLRLPMKHFVHQRYVSKPLNKAFVAPPVNADPYLGYLRPATGGRILMGVETPDGAEFPIESAEFCMSELASRTTFRDEARQRFLKFAPTLNDVGWESEHVGLISFTSDGEPILGPVPEFPQLFVAASFHSGGFSYSTVAGRLLAELVVDGSTSIDISAFAPDRFHAKETEDFLGSVALQSNVVRRRH